MNKIKEGNTSEIRNYGFKLNILEDLAAYRLGAMELPKIVLRPDGQWDDYLPKEELQITPNYETFACTIYGTENILQILEKFHYGKTREYAERYNYNLVKIVPPGADPHDAAESFRNDGVIPLSELPMTSTLEEYSKPRPMPNSYIAKGIAHPYELRHQWLWTSPLNKEDRTRIIKEHLKYSPLGVSVTAWNCPNGICIDSGQRNTHWTVLYGWNDQGWKIFDSYSLHKKILSYDHQIEVCKRYQLVKSTRQEQFSLLQKILQLLTKWLNLIDIPTTELLPPQPEPLPEPSKPTKYDFSIAGKFGTAWKSVRIICDEEGLSVKDKNDLCATVGAESGWKTNAKLENKSNGKVWSSDWGIAQINDHYHIGVGKSFPSVDYVLNNPEAVIRWMCKQWKAGNKNWWVTYKNGSYRNFL